MTFQCMCFIVAAICLQNSFGQDDPESEEMKTKRIELENNNKRLLDELMSQVMSLEYLMKESTALVVSHSDIIQTFGQNRHLQRTLRSIKPFVVNQITVKRELKKQASFLLNVGSQVLDHEKTIGRHTQQLFNMSKHYEHLPSMKDFDERVQISHHLGINEQLGLATEIRQLVHISNYQEMKLQKQEKKTEKVVKRKKMSSYFLARVGPTTTINEFQTLIFENVQQYPRKHFHEATGTYTAPIHGLYTFSLWTSCKNCNKKSVAEVAIEVDGKVQASCMVNYYYYFDQSSVTINVKLRRGQVVSCQVNYVSKANFMELDPNLTGFTGHLIRPL